MAKILLVDDEPSILSILATLLDAEGHDIVSATHGAKAQELIVAEEFDLMISDIRMSPISGMDLLRFAHKECADLAVIMLTAYGQVETAVEALELGAFDYIKKPFKADHLLATVEKALEFREFGRKESPS